MKEVLQYVVLMTSWGVVSFVAPQRWAKVTFGIFSVFWGIMIIIELL